MNIHYVNRYSKFIESISLKGDRNIDEYTELHHIKPRCMGGTDSEDNLVRLTLREHFIAHWILWKAYPNHLGIASAFLQMNNKNPKLVYKSHQGKISSKVYKSLKTCFYDMMKEFNKDKVYIKNSRGKTILLSKEEYARQNEHKFHTTGKLSVVNLETNKREYINCNIYHKNKEKYITNLHSSFNRTGGGNSHPVGNIYLNPNEYSFHFLNTETNNIEKITKSKARDLNKQSGYKKYKQIVNAKVSCIDIENNQIAVDLFEYYSNKNLNHIMTNKLIVFDKKEKRHKKIDKETYFFDKSRYLTSTKNKVLAKDKNNNTVLVEKSIFDSGDFVGITKGLRTVKDIRTDKYVQITEEEYNNNKELYTGPCKGKVNARNKITGEIKQISKNEYDQNKHIWAGSTYGTFNIKNKETKEIKKIDIWQKHLYNNKKWESLSRKYKLD